jgi:ABC-type transport system involved in multi-copper enzyme maturation permease subunit
MSQTVAIVHDAMRRLKAGKIFWIVLVLTAVVAGCQALVGINERGLTLLGMQLDTPMFSTEQIPQEAFYKLLFTNIGLRVWLSWIATILALISTAGIFPNLMAGGTIDLVLAKPIGRLRLFFTEYAGGLLFVTLQVTVFTVISILVLGLRGGVWEPGLLLAIPIVVAFFSFLYCVCVLLGVLTRSTVAALLLTLGFWFLLYLLNVTDVVFMQMRAQEEIVLERREAAIGAMESVLGGAERVAPGSSLPVRGRLENYRRRAEDQRDHLRTLEKIHGYIVTAKTFLPKTSETIDLLERSLISTANLPRPPDREMPVSATSTDRDVERVPPGQLQQRIVEMSRGRSTRWILGTSLAFEVAILATAAWVFCRRDF